MTIRVLIVDDSLMAREVLRDIFEGQEDFVVVGEAKNGQEALVLAKEKEPTLITMDLEMPVMDGFQTIQEIMRTKAIPILVVSSVTDAENAYRAISCGAVDAVSKPSILEADQEAFIKKARLVSQIPVIKRIRPVGGMPILSPLLSQTVAAPVAASVSEISEQGGVAICIASSTGGPQALAELFQDLDADVNVPIFIAQHISDGFASGMAHWLDGLTTLEVKVPLDGEQVCANTVYISPSEKNMTLGMDQKICLMDAAPQDIYHPNCNILLESVAEVYGQNCIGVILSGMGSDGTKGLQRVLERGGITIGQDEQSSVVYGMNNIAMQAGAVKRELPLSEIASALRHEIAVRRNHLSGKYDVS